MDFYNFSGDKISHAYTFDGTVISAVPEQPSLDGYTTYDEAVRYAYQEMRKADGTPFALYADNHNYWVNSNNRLDFWKSLAKVADWSDMYMLDMGDSTNMIVYDQYVNRTSNNLANIDSAMDIAHVPENHRIKIFGNHDMWRKDEDNVTRAHYDHAWLLEKYFRNSGAVHYYDNDFVQNVGDFSFVSLGAWDFDRDSGSALGGYSHYVINSDHMDAIIQMLTDVSGDIVILTHVPIWKSWSSRFNFNAENDGVGAIGDAVSMGATSNPLGGFVYEMVLDAMIEARSNHTSGTIKDSYGNDHSYDFSGCTGKVLCTLSGHSHHDWYGYTVNGGMLDYTFDCNYQTPYGTYFGKIDKDAMLLRLWKVDITPMVYAYTVPMRE